MKNNKYYTIGHSNHNINDFISLLVLNNINYLIDVRSLPGSNKHPQYNKESLELSLEKENINYIHIKELGGLKNKSNINENINSYWKNKSFKNYADYAYSNNNFLVGIDKLINIGDNYICAIMCAEVLWWRCHRRIITDYLISYKKNVFHIISAKKNDKALINENAIIKNKRITYK